MRQQKSQSPDAARTGEPAPDGRGTAEQTPSIGAQIRDLRKARGLTIAELAEGIGRSSGYVSQIERELSGVSISSLQRIANVLGVQISWFFQGQVVAPQEERDIIVRRHNRRRLDYGETGIMEELLSPTLTGSFEVIMTTFEPGSSTGQRERQRKGEEAGVVLSGALELWMDNKCFLLQAGDSFTLREPGWHRCVNPGDVDAVILWIISPPSY
ncbi:MAG: cupin domain-containing protein [Hyphomicrobiales bacterium]|nr:cupin domain-containing protein [Hyphomicrobiales bacterium]MCP5372677.1 cupin domain-containing protein [Hyphomicrobiales bacterium]